MSQTSAIEAELEAIEIRLARRRVGTRAELEELLAENFREFGCSGHEYSREALLSSYDYAKPTEFEITDYRVSVLSPDVILATYCSTQPGGRQARRSSVWRQERGGWRLAFHQGTLTS